MKRKKELVIVHLITLTILIFCILGVIIETPPIIWSIVWILWSLTISQAFAYVIKLLKNKNELSGLGEIIAIFGFGAFILPLLFSPIIAIFYYIDLFKKKKDN